MDQAGGHARPRPSRCPLRRRTLGRRAPYPQGDIEYHSERFTRLLVDGETNVNTIIGETFDEGVLVSPTQGRVTGGRPEGGQFACTEHSDAVVGPLPRRPADKVTRCDRNQQRTRQRQREVLDAQGDELASKIRRAATASSAIQMLGVLPQAATLS